MLAETETNDSSSKSSSLDVNTSNGSTDDGSQIFFLISYCCLSAIDSFATLSRYHAVDYDIGRAALLVGCTRVLGKVQIGTASLLAYWCWMSHQVARTHVLRTTPTFDNSSLFGLLQRMIGDRTFT